MCGRYYADDDTIREIARLVGEIDKPELGTETGDILPSRQAAVITGLSRPLAADRMAWGFPRFDGKGLLINARAESALEKRSFRDSVLHRRCVIPARGFYEWNKEKEKFTFERPDRDVLFMAGCFCSFGGQDRFVILTTAANASVSPVHSRMPLILERDELTVWVQDDKETARLLEKVPAMLTRKTEYEQLCLF